MSEQEATIEQDNTDVIDQPAEDPAPVAPAAEIDPKLLEKLSSLKLIVKMDSLLQKGIFLGQLAEDVLLAKEFLANLHGPLLKEAQAHPDWEKVTKAPPTPADLEAMAKAEEKRNRKERRSH